MSYKAIIQIQPPYIFLNKHNELDGVMYHMWKHIKEKCEKHSIFFQEIIQHENQPSQSNINADVIVGLFHLKDHQTSNTNFTCTQPLFVRTFNIVKYSKNHSLTLFKNMFQKKFLPIIIFYVIISCVLGCILFYFSPRKNAKNAIWQTLVSIFGESGYLTEKLSDYPQQTTIISYIVTFLILLCTTYAFLYIQAIMNTTLVNIGKNNQTNILNNDKSYTILISDLLSNKITIPKSNIYLKTTEQTKDTDVFFQYMDNQNKFDGVLIDLYSFETNIKPTLVLQKKFDDISIFSNPEYKHLICLRVSNSEKNYQMLLTINKIILQSHQNKTMEDICMRFTKNHSLCLL